MGDENQPSKKRAAGRELSRDNPGLDDEEDVPEQEMGTFKKASDEVLANRRIVKVRRQQTTTAPSTPSSNPFAGIRLVPPTVPAATPTNAVGDPHKKDAINEEAEVTSKESEEKSAEAAAEPEDKEKKALDEQGVKVNQSDQADTGDAAENTAESNPTDEKEAAGSAEKAAEAERADEEKPEGENIVKKDPENSNASGVDGGGDAPLSSFHQLSNSQNAFSGLASSGFSSPAFSFGSIQNGDSVSQSTLPTFSFGASNNGSTPLFGTTGVSSLGNKSEGTAFPPMQEVPSETGEEKEETIFAADSALFEFLDGGWKERGKGEVKVNVLKEDENQERGKGEVKVNVLKEDENQKARLVMRAKGNLRLIMNASLYPDMKLTKMDKRGVTFPCINTATEGKGGLSTFALKFKDVSVLEEFCTAVSAHKGKTSTVLRTPENSPRTSEN